MHPTNNRSSPEWFPWPRSSSKINRRRGFDKIIQIHRRHGFGEIIQKTRSTVGDKVSAKNWGRFWCSWTNRKWPNLIPDCNNREVKLQLGGSRLGRVPCQSKLQRKIAGTSSWPSWISHFTGSIVGHSPSEMLCPPANVWSYKMKFYICSDVTHTQRYMCAYIYLYILYIYISLEKPSLNYQLLCMCACMPGCMYVCMYGKITNKQSIEWNMYTTWDASLQDLRGCIPCGT